MQSNKNEYVLSTTQQTLKNQIWKITKEMCEPSVFPDNQETYTHKLIEKWSNSSNFTGNRLLTTKWIINKELQKEDRSFQPDATQQTYKQCTVGNL